ncbi:hypothetical protein [uncultured Thermanaerothrix sp.]|uniref:hypothetical protein n=1 Tax=uncultured Thermanaerothrix sp. TaxID=1195149 RepID=UPI002607833D|nr:hypothetical protein [uncultured Thermanaerothrix sp.]
MVDLVVTPGLQSNTGLRAVYYLAIPPRRVERGREREQLWLALWASRGGQVEEALLKTWLDQAAVHYYRTRGSVSLALRQAFEHLNQRALALNQAQGASAPFLAAAVVLRREQIYLALSGPLHVWLFSGPDVTDLFSSELAGRGLGIGRAWGMRFYHWMAQPHAVGLFSPVITSPPTPGQKGWQKVEGVWIKVVTGSGQIRYAERMPNDSEVIPGVARGADLGKASMVQEGLPPLHTGEVRVLGGGHHVTETVYATSPSPENAPPESHTAAPAARTAPHPTPNHAETTAPRNHRQPVVSFAIVGRALAKGLWGVWQGIEQLNRRLNRLLGQVLPRFLPADSALVRVSPSTLVFLAVAIPLVVVTVALIVYWRQGRLEQHRLYLQQAQQVASQALGQSDPALKRVNLEAALTWVEKAEQYGQSAESKALRMGIYQNLDALDGVRRLVFQTLLPGGMGGNVQVGKMVATSSEDLYVLDRSRGSISRLVATQSGYALDSQFACRPGQIGSLIVGPFVDLLALPASNFHNAQVMAIDANGNVVYCGFKGNQPVLDAVALQPPDQGWGSVKSITVRQGNLIVLDALQNGLYEYRGSQWDFVDQPKALFGAQVISLSNAVSLAAFQDDIFILYEDGHVSRCSGWGTVECQDPFPFRLNQDGQIQEVPRLNVAFTDWTLTPPPDPALYLLDSSSPSVYYFSLMLSLQQQYRPSLVEGERLPERSATAFTITPGRNLVLAFGNLLYLATLP